ncbi:MAG: PD-(D/E)XK nuclease family protein [Betaproteobacteria bacterium]|jgi:hypothetical protein
MDKKTRVSYSQFTKWQKCSQWWAYDYIDKLAVPDQNIHTIFGTAMHTVIQEWLTESVYGNKTLKYAKTVDLSERLQEELVKESTPWLKRVDDDGNEFYLFTVQELQEFYEQGLLIISYIQENLEKIFPTENESLHSIEYPCEVDLGNGLYYIGYIDIVTYNIVYDEYTLWDLKATTKGWNKYTKKDKLKTDQVLIYKKFFSDIEGVPLENINVEYVVMKRKLWESPYKIPRVSKFSPSDGPRSVKRAYEAFSQFVKDAHVKGERSYKKVVATPSKSNCRFCPYADGVCSFAYNEKKEELLDNTEMVSLF